MKLLAKNSLYRRLILRNIRFRKGLTFNIQSTQSIILRILKIVPFLVGIIIGRTDIRNNNGKIELLRGIQYT